MQLKSKKLWLLMPVQVALHGDRVLALEILCGSSGTSEKFLKEKRETLGGMLTKNLCQALETGTKGQRKSRTGRKKTKELEMLE